MNERDHYHHGELRAALIARAIATIAQNGVEALSLRALARDIGVSHAAPMRHFATRTDLLTAIAREGVEALIGEAEACAAEPGLTGLAKLRAMTEGYVRWARSYAVYHLILRNQDVMRHADEALLRALHAYAELQQRTIAQAQSEGWRSNDPPHLLWLQVIGFTAGLAVVATDPIYQTPLHGQPSAADLDAAIAAFYAR
ncbi:MAG: TetR/AcrR family transcriptional regulator [Oscillochloris sp.]|nr:TetR/AcrR family transcriptional regulator [Oscillochloris sp.]